MKMRKLLATAVAASIAVTSMATVASAAEKTWSMGHTSGTIAFAGSTGIELGDEFLLDDDAFETGASTLGISNNDSITVKANVTDWTLTGVSLKVTGVKGTRGAASKTYTYAFKDNEDGTYTLPVYAGSAPVDTFLPEQFLEMTKVEIGISGVRTTDDQEVYEENSWGTWVGNNTLSIVTDFTEEADILSIISALVVNLEGNASNGGNAWGFCAYATDASTSVSYAWMPRTEWTDDDDDILGRYEIIVLSDSDDYVSNDYQTSDGNTNQSYVDDDTTAGTEAEGFSGLASQVADFFNKQTNGTITFKFTTPDASSSGTAWENGGIPSTQTGIKNYMGDATANDFALFVNYKQTGSLQAVTSLDTAAGTVTFDISDILDSMGGQTLGNIDNIYYGLRKGIEYDRDGDNVKEAEGLYVESVTLAYDEDADVDADIEEEDDDADVEIEDDVEIEEDDDVEIEEDDDVEIDEDDADEDDADAEGDVIVGSEDDDANPGTGVALAVVPALVAAAAVVVSKKRS